ncbi:MAG TPA: enolase C-terminal domain-like protein, partial [Bryobacteraceae bacterium]
MGKASDVQIREVRSDYEEYAYRTPIKFGGSVVDSVTLFNVHVRVRTRDGKEAWGFGSMPLGNVWAFPSKQLSVQQTLAAMKLLSSYLTGITGECREVAHPVELNRALETEYHRAAVRVARDLRLAEPIPSLCTLVAASPIDAAIHDAFGKANGINCYRGYGPGYMNRDLGSYLAPDFDGEYLDRYVSPTPKATMPLYHLVGALDPIFETDIAKRINDGIPEALTEWISADGLTHVKIKLNGDDVAWDITRVLAVNRAAEQADAAHGVTTWFYSLDFNERAPNPEYVLDFLRRIEEASPAAFGRIQYIEQPTARDLKANLQNRMHRVARIKPVVIDESLVDFESLLLARELGYSGVALKACKGQSASLLMGAAAQRFGMFLCVQDLTCPGASLLHSAGLAARIPGVAAIESNARQYVPAANAEWAERFPGIFHVQNGCIGTGVLNG